MAKVMPIKNCHYKNEIDSALLQLINLCLIMFYLQLFVKVYDDDLKTSKTMLIDQTWTARDVKQKMVQKDDVEPGPNWCILEKLSHMYLGKVCTFLFKVLVLNNMAL